MKTKLIALFLLFIPVVAWADPSPTPSGDENLKNALAEIVKSATTTLNDVKSATPEFFQQYIEREIFSNNLWSIGLTLAAIALTSLGFTGIAFSRTHKGEKFDQTAGVWFIIISVVIMIFGPMRLQIDNHLMKIAPKVYAIEFAKTLIK